MYSGQCCSFSFKLSVCSSENSFSRLFTADWKELALRAASGMICGDYNEKSGQTCRETHEQIGKYAHEWTCRQAYGRIKRSLVEWTDRVYIYRQKMNEGDKRKERQSDRQVRHMEMVFKICLCSKTNFEASFHN